jgi:protein-tyrosine phosphatase
LQVNVCSLLGRHGPEAREAAVRLVRDGHAYVVASDGHGSRHRAHTLGAGPAAARAAGVSALRGDQLAGANPRFLLRNGIPREARPDDRTPWQSSRRRRVSAALAAARNRR